MRHLTILVTALFTLACAAQAGDRVALVIGNAGYQTLPKLPACERDARLIADIFSTKLGISIHGGKPLTDLTAGQMDDALHAFAAKLGPETEAYLYFSGHGVQADGVNYLLPVDYSAKYKVQLKRQAISLDDVLAVLEESKAKLRVIILDSCRSPGEFLQGEPAEKGFSRKGGLAEQKVENPDTLVCFATKHGTPAFSPDAFDTTSTSLYTSVLAEEILKPGKIEDVLKNVAIGVYAKTEKQQLPFTYGSLLHNFSFLPGGVTVVARTETNMPSIVTAATAGSAPLLGGSTLPPKVEIKVEPQHPAGETSHVSAPQQPVGSQLTDLEPAKNAVASFLASKTIDERVGLVRDRSINEKRMRDYYALHGDGPVAYERIEARDVNLQGAFTYNFNVVLGDGTRREVMAGKSKSGKYLVDWASFILYSEMDWSEFKTKRTRTGVMFRLLVTPADYFSGEFSNSQAFLCLKLVNPAEPKSPALYGYLKKSESLGRALKSVTEKSHDQAQPLMLKIAYPENGKSDNQVLITEFIGEGWVAKNW